MAETTEKLTIGQELTQRYKNVLSTQINLKAVVSEFWGVLAFVFLGCGAATITGFYSSEPENEMVRQAIVGAGFGLGIVLAIYSTAHNGAGHLNPAVTTALIATGNCPLLQGLLQMAGQIVGAIVSAALIKASLPAPLSEGALLGANTIPADSSAGRAFIVEIIGTFIPIYVVLEAAINPRSQAKNIAPLVIGFTFGIVLTVISPISSGSLNPARTLGPATITGQNDDIWIWLVGPIIGALIAVPFHLFSVIGGVPGTPDEEAAKKAKDTEDA